jgi:NAD(P)-dependent dehydrogenase (short-subunit alcohol dehydrogenase family)
MDLKEKVIVVLGANGGIGSAVVAQLTKEEAKVVPLTREDIDLTKTEKMESASAAVIKEYPRIDAFINATGIGIYGGIKDTTKDNLKTSLDINLVGPLLFIKGLLPAMNKKDSVIINIGSGLGKKPYSREKLPYIISKFALRGMSLALAKDFEGKFPNFCLVSLGSVMTSFGTGGLAKRIALQKKGKLYFTPEWVAERIAYIIKDKERQAEYTFYPKDYVT